jgi:hypothetical protein
MIDLLPGGLGRLWGLMNSRPIFEFDSAGWKTFLHLSGARIAWAKFRILLDAASLSKVYYVSDMGRGYNDMHKAVLWGLTLVGLVLGTSISTFASPASRLLDRDTTQLTAGIDRIDYNWHHHQYHHRSWAHHHWHYY